MIDSLEAEFAVAAVGEAALLAADVQQALVTPALTKADRSPVTVADLAVQAVIAQRLVETFPAAVLIGEENSDTLRAEDGRNHLSQVTRFVQQCYASATDDLVLEWIDRGAGAPQDNFWTLDPVDGTKGFLRGDHYAVALGRIVDGQAVVAALACPQLRGFPGETDELGMVVVAERGHGAWAKSLRQPNGWHQLSVSQRKEVAEARFLRSVESAHTNTGAIGELMSALGVKAEPVGMDSQAKYAVLAAGQGEVLLRLLSPSRLDYREKIWDQAAGSLIVEEAGGRVTDLDGKPLDFSCGRTLARNRGVLATNGLLHDQVLNGVRQVGA